MSANEWMIVILWPATVCVLGVTLANTTKWIEERRRARAIRTGSRRR